MKNDLVIKNKDCYTLITGACGGLGRAFVFECIKNNENLILTGTSQEKLMSLLNDISELISDKNISVKTFVCNLASDEDRKNLLMFVINNNLKVTTLINNAGVIIEGALERFSDEEIENAIKVNCIGTLDLTKKLIENRDKNFKFKVLTVASLACNFPIPYMAVYSATKSFLVSIMTALSIEYKKQNVSFTTICPSGMPTTKEMKESIKSMGLGGKISSASPEKVAKISLKALKKGKKVVNIGFFNKILVFFSKFFSKFSLAKITGRIWKKSQDKRKF